MIKPESVVERQVVVWATNAGIINMKFTPIGQRGWPDHLFMKWGRVCFIEFKALGEELRKLQQHRVDQLRSEKIPVICTDNYEEAVKFLESTFYA